MRLQLAKRDRPEGDRGVTRGIIHPSICSIQRIARFVGVDGFKFRRREGINTKELIPHTLELVIQAEVLLYSLDTHRINCRRFDSVD